MDFCTVAFKSYFFIILLILLTLNVTFRCGHLTWSIKTSKVINVIILSSLKEWQTRCWNQFPIQLYWTVIYLQVITLELVFSPGRHFSVVQIVLITKLGLKTSATWNPSGKNNPANWTNMMPSPLPVLSQSSHALVSCSTYNSSVKTDWCSWIVNQLLGISMLNKRVTMWIYFLINCCCAPSADSICSMHQCI